MSSWRKPGPITPGRSCAEEPTTSLRKTTAGGNGSWLSPGRRLRRNRARRDVHRQSQQRRVVDERDDAVRGGGAADGLVGDADVGDLRGHTDHEREIDEVPIVGVVFLVSAR